MPSLFPVRLVSAGRCVGGRWVWRGLDWTVLAGRRLAVRGPSGAGKTLLLRALCGLDALDEGRVDAGGSALTQWPLPSYRARVRYVAQRPALFPGTVRDNVSAAGTLAVHAPIGESADMAAAADALARIGRSPRLLDQPVDGLSGGEQQLVALLRALQGAPALLLLDEPTASLDPDATAAVEALVADWLDADPAHTVVWTSHDPDQLARVADAGLTLPPPPP